MKFTVPMGYESLVKGLVEEYGERLTVEFGDVYGYSTLHEK